VIKVRRRPTPDRDLPPGYQHGYWPPQPWTNAHKTPHPFLIFGTAPLRRADREIAEFFGWNVIEGEHHE
jgi:hypothetical protein